MISTKEIQSCVYGNPDYLLQYITCRCKNISILPPPFWGRQFPLSGFEKIQNTFTFLEMGRWTFSFCFNPLVSKRAGLPYRVSLYISLSFPSSILLFISLYIRLCLFFLLLFLLFLSSIYLIFRVLSLSLSPSLVFSINLFPSPLSLCICIYISAVNFSPNQLG